MNGKKAKECRKAIGFNPAAEREYVSVATGKRRPVVIDGKVELIEQFTQIALPDSPRSKYKRLKREYKKCIRSGASS